MSAKRQLPVFLGIDFGTCHSVMAVLEDGSPVVIPTAEGEARLPSIVAQRADGEWLVGWPARRQAVSNPANTVCSIKRLIGMPTAGGDIGVMVGPKAYSPQELSAMILQRLKADAETYLDGTVARAVVTVPAYFDHHRRRATREAAIAAGFDVLRIISEPTAAALAWGVNRLDERTIAVCHLGGGTFDVSIIETGEGTFQVKATNGDTGLGGDDFDHRIVDWLINGFKREHGVDLSEDKTALRRVKEAAESAKCELSTRIGAEISLPWIAASSSGPLKLNIVLTRSRLEGLVKDLVARLVAPCRQALSDAGLFAHQVDEVVLVGGQTRMPLVRSTLVNLFGEQCPVRNVSDSAVAAGAAIMGGILMGDLRDLLLLDVIPFSLGLEAKGGATHVLIPRNTTIPTSQSVVLSTAVDDQTSVSIRVVQGEDPFAGNNRTLGFLRLDGILPALRGVPQIRITFDIDSDGILTVSAFDEGTGRKAESTIGSSG